MHESLSAFFVDWIHEPELFRRLADTCVPMIFAAAGEDIRPHSRDAKRKLPAERHGELLAKAVEISQAEGLSAVTLRRVAADLGVTPSLVSQYFSAAEQLITAAFQAAAIAEIVRAGVADGEFRVADVEVTARRLLTMIDGLGAQKVVRGVPSDEAKHIAGAYFASELGVAD